MLLILQTEEIVVEEDVIRFNAPQSDCFKAFADAAMFVVWLQVLSFRMKLILVLPPTQMISAWIVSRFSFVRTLMISEIASG